MTTQTHGRRRVTSSRPNPNLGSVVQSLRLRKGMTQRALADAVGLKGSSTISRIESGAIDRASHNLLTRLGLVLGDPETFWSAVLTLSDDAIDELAPYWRAFPRQTLLGATVPAVRRVHYRLQAAELLINAPDGTIGSRVNPNGLAAALDPPRTIAISQGEEQSITHTETRITITIKSPNEATARITAVRRFLAAHAVAHVVLDSTQACEWPGVSAHEERADELACQLIAPTELIETTLRRLDPANDPWDPDTGDIVARLAEALGVPTWVAVRRLGEEDLLHSTAEDIDL